MENDEIIQFLRTNANLHDCLCEINIDNYNLNIVIFGEILNGYKIQLNNVKIIVNNMNNLSNVAISDFYYCYLENKDSVIIIDWDGNVIICHYESYLLFKS